MAFLEGIFVNLNKYDFNPERHIGSGSYGFCYIVTDKEHPGQQLCAKITQDTPQGAKEQEELLREVVVLKNVQHNTILGFKGFNLYDFDQNPRPTIITDYMKNGALDKMLEKEAKGKAPANWTSTKKQICILGVAAAMRYLHRRNLMHRDLKPANVLLDDNLYPKVCDFGFARASLNLNQVTQRVGSPIFMAPEILHGADDYGPKVDVYSFAILAYQVCTGKMPYAEFFRIHRNPTFVQLATYVYDQGKRPTFDDCHINNDFKTLIEQCWKHNPEDRPTFDQIYDLLTDDLSLVINEEVDLPELHSYIDLIQDASTDKGKAQLSRSAPLVLNDDRPTPSGNQAPSKIPETDEARVEMLKKVLANFALYDADTQLTLFSKLLGYITTDDSPEGHKNFAHIAYYANTLAAQKNQKAIDFLTEAFGQVIGQNKSSLSNGDLPRIVRSRFNISQTVTKIDPNTFENRQILFVNLPPSIEKIGVSAFKGCNKITFISLNNKMTVIEDSTFEGCSSLGYVDFPNGLKVIKKNAFKKCTSLTEIYLPASLKTVEPNAFQGCKNLKIVHISNHTSYDKKLSFPLRANILT